ncbi:hypothetical protein F5Y16DRAFT_363701 [Xylariaceae sp. FL0255]|nr:hypothetical protein F5Y16DRAFT_363701 [Xylariaceae sp. FL0255]
MKKFGFGSKKNGGDEDPKRAALFGNRAGSSTPQSDNPYAQQPASDPYMREDNTKYAPMNAYQRARDGLPSGPAASRGGYGATPLDRNDSVSSSGTAPPPYSNNTSGGYGNDRYGTSSGYGGGNKYAGANSYGNASASGASSRPGGYGGMGRTESASDEARDALFSGARDRYDNKQIGQGAVGGGYGQSGVSGADDNRYGGGYGDQREMTEEEKEAAEYKNIKSQIHQTTQASLQTNQNSLRYMNQALDTGLATYARLGDQNERLHRTDQLLDQATESHRHAEAQTKKLKSLNRSMFAVHVKNPFTEKRRTAEEEARILQQNQADREIREATRRDKFAQNARMEQTFAGFDREEAPSSFTRANRGDRSKYTLEDDSDEEGAAALEQANEQIERDLEQMSIGVGKLKRIGQAMGEELDHSNKLIERIGTKTDPLDDQIRVTNARMNRIR